MNLLTDIRAWEIVVLISMLGVGASLVPYTVGKRGLKVVLTKFPQVKQERLERVQTLYRKHGSGLLFFSFIPIVGFLLNVGAGIVGMRVSTFVLWVLLSRITCYSILLMLIALGQLVLSAH